ncbi:MAG: ThiF family adenylyltransferase, partial [Bdellovibrionales bacterium]|nr:ThiF family adenylyltransferase [Bdellovibrionales bacterium]
RGNALEIASSYDILVDCTDNFPSRYLVNDTGLKLGKPVVFGAVTGTGGQFAVFWGKRGACYRCLHPAPPASAVGNCQEAGVVGPAVGVVGSWQAMESIKVALDLGGLGRLRPQYGRLSVLEFSDNAFRTVPVIRRPGCLCGGVEFELSEFEGTCRAVVREISAIQELGADVGLIDVREAGEFVSGSLEGAFHWPLSAIERGEFPPFLGQRKAWVVFCAGGKRSRRAIERMGSSGALFFQLQGGMSSWRS